MCGRLRGDTPGLIRLQATGSDSVHQGITARAGRGWRRVAEKKQQHTQPHGGAQLSARVRTPVHCGPGLARPRYATQPASRGKANLCRHRVTSV
ncbi:hypothetical protein RRG08_010439 [Elysia crispata]|uniref:Uncharacterized protein n=1 Tax=Elysia crispata TaxID=231223 RepID=A0AAE1AB78_9GAST|nr:hypothetical protein RRG08_010439 [Elysia crispata]